jgi:hypothetical protein
MSLLSIFRRPTLEQYAELRDQLIVAETRAALLQDLVEHPPQPRRTRERRKDARDVRSAFEATTASLIASTRTQPSVEKQRGRE